MEKENKQPDPRRSRIRMIVMYILTLVITCAACLCYSGYVHYDEHLESEGELISASADQIALSVNMQLSKLEDASTTLLSNKEYMAFDAADSSMGVYQSAQKLAELKKTITGLSLIDNYCDFAMVYRNSVAAGKLSDSTRERLCDVDGELYPQLKRMLGSNRRVWITGVGNNYDKIYFISEANDHACFLGSFYTEELRFMFTPVNGLEASGISLLDEEGNIIISAGTDNITPIEHSDKDKYISIKSKSIQAVTTMDTGWKVVIHKDMTAIFELYRKLALETAAVLVLALALLLILYIVNFKDDTFIGGAPLMTPDVDMLTGITNEEEAENLAADRLETCISGSTLMLALVKIINLNDIAHKYGRAGYNGAIIKTFRGLAGFFGTDDPDCKNILGRAGEGKFLIMADYTQYDLFKANDNLKEGLVQLSERLNSIYIDTPGDINICIGASVYPHNSTDYDELFEMAEKALEEALKDDEKTYALYRKEKGQHK